MKHSNLNLKSVLISVQKNNSDESFLARQTRRSRYLIKLKARLVAGGDRQDRNLYPNRSSPTAAIQSIFSVINIAASEGRKVLTFDVAMAYL